MKYACVVSGGLRTGGSVIKLAETRRMRCQPSAAGRYFQSQPSLYKGMLRGGQICVDNLFAGRGARAALVHLRFEVLRHDRVELDDDLNFAYPASARPNGSRHALSQASTDRRHLKSPIEPDFGTMQLNPPSNRLLKRIIPAASMTPRSQSAYDSHFI
jgi:hypothetical protein